MIYKLMLISLCISMAVYAFNESGLSDPARSLITAVFALLPVALLFDDEDTERAADDE